jgi:hypothetical protein
MATAELVSGDGTRIDLRNIPSPILCFYFEGDNITPPPRVRAQARLVATVSAQSNADVMEWLHRLTPAELPYHVFSELNPLMTTLADLAERVRKARKPVSDDNWLVKQQENYSGSVVAALDGFRDFRDGAIERCFMTFYGSPVVQAMAGLKTTDGPPRPHPGKTPESVARVERCMAENHGCIGEGGVHEAVVRSLVYISMGGGGVDERAFNALCEMRAEYSTLSFGSFKKTVREQFFALRLDQQAALDAIPAMLFVEIQSKDKALSVIHRVASAAGKLTAEQDRRLAVVEGLFAD